jgi:hypothetical protein
MFSIENLAWNGYTSNLIPEEIGNGDPISGRKGRIMWFPPYDLSFTDSTSVNWEKTDFIGRGEPIYTYNNTTRTGSLQFKIIIDHPSYVNSLKGESDDLINSLFTGGFEVDKRVRNRLSADELANADLAFNQAVDKVNSTPQTAPPCFDIYFPYGGGVGDSLLAVLNSGYENGLQTITFNKIDYGANPTGDLEGLNDYTTKNGLTVPDTTNYGLNSELTNEFLNELQISFIDVCPACKVKLKVVGNESETDEVLLDRVYSVVEYFKSTIYPNDTINSTKRYISDGVSRSGPSILIIPPLEDPADTTVLDKSQFKNTRKVSVCFEWDVKLAEELNPNTKDKIPDPLGDTNATRRLTEGIKSRFYTEEGYFRKLEQEDKFIYDSLSQKIGFFHPSFHSITPEGFNSRLTFLQQCTRQGPTIYQNGESGPTFDLNRSSDAVSPDNLAFGSPPVCILRLGDFYNTKIILDSVNFGFDPLVWDLNPEGIGVQPMICTVDLNFAFIGGSSLQGPISKLQNAVTYNFFANTQTYEPASNYMGLTGINAETGEEQRIANTYNSVGGGDYYPGSVNKRSIVNPATVLDVTSIPLPAVDQEAQLQQIQSVTAPIAQPTSGVTADLNRIKVTRIEIVDSPSPSGIFVNITFIFEGVDADESSTHFLNPYQLGVVTIEPDGSTNQYSVKLYEDRISLDGEAPTQIIRGQVFFSDDELKVDSSFSLTSQPPVTDNTSVDLTSAIVYINIGEVAKMEKGEGETLDIISNVTSNNSIKYGPPP